MSTITTLGPVGFNPTGNYDSTRQYEKLDVVYYQGSSYVAIADSLGQIPTNAQYWDCIALGTLKQFTYDNVASMKLDNSLEDGKIVETIGYYSSNDGGAATYKIRTKTNEDTPDDMTIIQLYDANLVAELLIEDIIFPEQLGAKGDGTTDDSLAFTKALITGKPIYCDGSKTYGITRVTIPNISFAIYGNGCKFKNIKLNMSEWSDGSSSYRAISSMFSNDIPSNNIITYYDNAYLSDFTIDQDSDNVTGLNNEMHWGGLFTPILLVGCKNVILDRVISKNSLQTPFYFYGVNNVKVSNCNIENVGNNANLDTGSRNCFETSRWGDTNNNCKFNATNITCYNIHDEFIRTDTCEYVNIDNCTFKVIGGTIVESHSSSDKTYPNVKYVNISNCTNDGSKGLVHINEQNTNVKAEVKINNVNNTNSDGTSNLYGVVYLNGKVECNIINSLFSHSGNKYGQGYFRIDTGSNIKLVNCKIDMINQIPVFRNYTTGQHITIDNCDITSNNVVRLENGGYLDIYNSKINSLYFITGIANEIRIYDSVLNPQAQYGIQPSFSSGIFEMINTTINSIYESASTFIGLTGTLKRLKFINNFINSVAITRVRFGSVTNYIEFIGNFVDADSSAFTGDRALVQDCLSIFTNNICKGTTFGISGTPSVEDNNRNFDVTA